MYRPSCLFVGLLWFLHARAVTPWSLVLEHLLTLVIVHSESVPISLEEATDWKHEADVGDVDVAVRHGVSDRRERRGHI